MRNQLRTMLSAWKESPYTQFRAADHRGFAYDKVVPQIAAAAKHTVMSGPYRGMKYFDEVMRRSGTNFDADIVDALFATESFPTAVAMALHWQAHFRHDCVPVIFKGHESHSSRLK